MSTMAPKQMPDWREPPLQMTHSNLSTATRAQLQEMQFPRTHQGLGAACVETGSSGEKHRRRLRGKIANMCNKNQRAGF